MTVPRTPRVATGFPAGCQLCDRDTAGVAEICPDCQLVAEGVVCAAEALGTVPDDSLSLDVLFAPRDPDEMAELTGMVSEFWPRQRCEANSLADLIRANREQGTGL